MTRDDARRIWKESGLTIGGLTTWNVKDLHRAVDESLAAFTSDTTYRLDALKPVGLDADGLCVELTARAQHRASHEAVTLRDGSVRIAEWAKEEVVSPIIDAFVDWVKRTARGEAPILPTASTADDEPEGEAQATMENGTFTVNDGPAVSSATVKVGDAIGGFRMKAPDQAGGTSTMALTVVAEPSTLELTRDDARRIWNESGLSIDTLTVWNLRDLHRAIDYALRRSKLIDETYRLEPLEPVNGHPGNPWIEIKSRSRYFEHRQAVTIQKDWVGFAGWASDENVAPILSAFVDWVERTSRGEEPILVDPLDDEIDEDTFVPSRPEECAGKEAWVAYASHMFGTYAAYLDDLQTLLAGEIPEDRMKILFDGADQPGQAARMLRELSLDFKVNSK